jgi:hypothetical protein
MTAMCTPVDRTALSNAAIAFAPQQLVAEIRARVFLRGMQSLSNQVQRRILFLRTTTVGSCASKHLLSRQEGNEA